MKLIVTNRKEFESYFDKPIQDTFTSKEIHKYVFHQLQKNLSVTNSIPLMILQNIDTEGWNDAEFRLEGYKENLCFYKFYGVIS